MPFLRLVLPSNSVLFSGEYGPTAPCLHAARGSGSLSGLVSLLGTHLLATTDDGCCPLPVGCLQPPKELHTHDRLPGSLGNSSSISNPPRPLPLIEVSLSAILLWKSFSPQLVSPGLPRTVKSCLPPPYYSANFFNFLKSHI